MQVVLQSIPLREALHFLGWRGTPLEPELISQLKELCALALENIQPRVEIRRFGIDQSGLLDSCAFMPQGEDIQKMLEPCHEVILLAATLGAASERLLLREQARSSTRAVMLDAVLSAAIEAVCDQTEQEIRDDVERSGLYLTDRFSPGYGDMPMTQTREICEVLSASKAIGLTVSQSGIMIPRKSVTAIMGVSKVSVSRRPSGCEGCAMRKTCALSRARE